jgi:hypothetical protein
MIIVGCDYHPSFQQIAYVDTETGEWKERRLVHREVAESIPNACNLRRLGLSQSVVCCAVWRPEALNPSPVHAENLDHNSQ